MKFKATIKFNIEINDMEKCAKDIDMVLSDLGNMYFMWDVYHELWEIKENENENEKDEETEST